MVTKTYFEKSNTIVEGSEQNFGLNPICMLHYGKTISRTLIYFNTDKLSKLVKDGTYIDKTKLKHVLKMTNSSSVNPKCHGHKVIGKWQEEWTNRAVSFDLIAFKIPFNWDEGVGFDFEDDFWLQGDACVSYMGSNWYNVSSGKAWFNENKKTNDGIYTNDFLTTEYEKFLVGEKSIIVASQHFDHGNEDMKLDLTDYVNSIIFDGEENHGLCLAFSPAFERRRDVENTQYVGFFNGHTNTLYEPFLESRYDAAVNDNRMNFYLGKKNRLYFYAYVGGELTNLDKLPTCTIEDKEYEVKQDTKGVYYVEVKFSAKDYEPDTILYDVWSNLSLDGEELDDEELEFVTLPHKGHTSLGSTIAEPKVLNVSLSGINDDEKIYQGDVRKIKAIFKVPYTSKDYDFPNEAYYRVYVKDSNREIDMIDWDTIEQVGAFDMFTLKTDEMLPAEYHIDIKGKFGYEERIFKDKLRFTIVNNATSFKK